MLDERLGFDDKTSKMEVIKNELDTYKVTIKIEISYINFRNKLHTPTNYAFAASSESGWAAAHFRFLFIRVARR